MNPKSMHRERLLGHMDIDTREWTDGVLTDAARKVVREPSETSCWIICDGDVDPEVRTLQFSTVHYIAVHYIAVQYIAVQYIAVQYSTLQYGTSHCITVHHIALHLNIAVHWGSKQQYVAILRTLLASCRAFSSS